TRVGASRRRVAGWPGKAAISRGLNAGVEPLAQTVSERPTAVGGTGRALRLHRLARHKTGQLIVKARPRAGLRLQMHHRAEAAGHGDQVALELRAVAGQTLAVGGQRRGARGLDAAAT